jgi:hypothetical protein
MVVPAVPFFAEICVFEGVLIGFMDALPWGEDMEAMCHEWGVADKVR